MSSSPASRDDIALVSAALSDARAFAAIVERYERPLGRYVRRLLGAHAQSAEDVLQEAFLKSYVNLNDYDRSRPFAPWIYRITHNEAIAYLRKRGSQPQALDGQDAMTLLEQLADAADTAAALDRAELSRAMNDALNGLGASYREVLALRYLEDMNYDGIADVLHLPMGTVATRIRRGLTQLKAALTRLGVEQP